MSEIRFDPIKRKWTVISHERGGRQDIFLTSSPDKFGGGEEKCPFCHIDDGRLLPPIFKISDPSDSSKNVLIVTPDKYPVMGIEGDVRRFLSGIFESASGVGAHEVIIDSPRHGLKAGDYTEGELYNLFKAFKARIEDLNKDVRFRYMAAFKNIGLESGELIRHPHGQIIASSVVPSDVENIMIEADKYYRQKERCLFCDIISEERRDKSRVVVENYEFVAFCPYASEYPFETVIYPKKHEAIFSRIGDNSLMQLADIVKEVFSRLSTLLDNPSLSMALRLSPMKPSRRDVRGYLEYIENSYHWHLEIKPAITKRSGNLWASGIAVNPLRPEEAAQYLREVSAI